MHTAYFALLVVLFVSCLVCGLVLYSMCIQRMYRKYITRCVLQTTHDVVDKILGTRPIDRMNIVESAVFMSHMRILILDTKKQCWMDTSMPHLARDVSTGERPGENLHLRNHYDTTQDPVGMLINVATRTKNGGFVEYENDLGEYKEWVYAFAKQLTWDRNYILCVERKSSSTHVPNVE